MRTNNLLVNKMKSRQNVYSFLLIWVLMAISVVVGTGQENVIAFACAGENSVYDKNLCLPIPEELPGAYNIYNCEDPTCVSNSPSYCWWVKKPGNENFIAVSGGGNSQTYKPEGGEDGDLNAGPGIYTFKRCFVCNGGCDQTDCSNEVNVIVLSTNTVTGPGSGTVCVNTAMTSITHTTTGATGIGIATGLPTGVTAAWAANTITISGTPTVEDTYNYTIPLTGGCGSVSATGTITVNATNTVTGPGSGTVCVNTAMTSITHTTTGATGIGTATGLPTGVTAAWAANTITISGTPTVEDTYNYTIPLSGGCGSVSATGTITVNATNTVTGPGSGTVCVNTAMTSITHTTTGATGIGTATGLPTGVTAAWAANTITISGTPTVEGTYNYTIPLNGGCGSVSATGTIIVNPLPSITSIVSNCTGAILNSVTINATISSGTLEYSSNGGFSYQSSNTFTGLTAGTIYTFVVRGVGTTCTASQIYTPNCNCPTVTGNEISSSQNICSGAVPSALTGGTPTVTPSTTFTYQWQLKPLGANIWTDITPGGTGQNYAPGALTVTTDFRRLIEINGCPDDLYISNTVTINVFAIPSSPVSGGNQTECAQNPLQTLTATATAPVGSDLIWYTTATGTIITNNPVLNQQGTVTYYAASRLSQSPYCENVVRTPVSLTILPTLTNNNISSPPVSVFCSTGDPETITGSLPSGGTGSYIYKWYHSTTSANTGFTEITGASGQNYNPPVISQTTWYRRDVISGVCSSESAVVTITIYPALANNNISPPSPIVFCSSGDPGSITGSLPSGGTGSYTYKWYHSTTSANTGFTEITGATGQNYDPSVISQTTWYRREVISGICNSESAVVMITVYPALANNSISSPSVTVFCSSGDPGSITGSTPSGGTGSYAFKWYQSTTSASSGFTEITGATGQNYDPPVISQTTWYRREVISGPCLAESPAVSITVYPPLTNNVITPPQNLSFCGSGDPEMIAGSSPSGGTGSYNYKWFKSTTSNSSGFTEITGATGQNYDPPVISQTTWYRREVVSGVCNGASQSVQISVHPLPQPSISISENSGPDNSNDGKICSMDAVSLTVNNNIGSPPYAYNWNSGEKTKTIVKNPGYSGENYTYNVTVTDNKNCLNTTSTSIEVFDTPLANIDFQTFFSPLKYERNFSLLGSNVKNNQTGNQYLWDFNIPQNRVILSAGYSYNSQNLENVKIKKGNNDSEDIISLLSITNGNNCKNTANFTFYIEVASTCDIEISNLTRDNCITNGSTTFQTKKLIPDAGATISNASAKVSKGTIQGFNNSIDNEVKINFTDSGVYIFDLEFKTDYTTCNNPMRRDSIFVFDTPSIQKIEKSTDTICLDDNSLFFYKVYLNKQKFQHNKLRKIKYSINGGNVIELSSNSDTIQVNLAKSLFNVGNNEIKIISVEYQGFSCVNNQQTLINVFTVKSCNCENLLIGNGFAKFDINQTKKEYCYGDTLRFTIPEIRFDDPGNALINNPFVRVLIKNENNVLDSLKRDLDKNASNNIIGFFALNKQSIPINKELFLTYEVAPNIENPACILEKAPERLKFQIFHTPVPVIDSIGSVLCNNSMNIPVFFKTDTISAKLFSPEFNWKSDQLKIKVSQGYISVETDNKETSGNIELTQINKYSTTFSCIGKDSIDFEVFDDDFAPNRSSISRYPGHIYYLEDTTANLCVQWGYSEATTEGGIGTSQLLNSTTIPKVSGNGFAVFANETVTGDLEFSSGSVLKPKGFLWADTWYKNTGSCNYETASCITRTYYNAALPPKFAPRGEPETYHATIFPNPNQGTFTLSLKGDWYDSFDVEVLDHTGRLVKHLGTMAKEKYFFQTGIDVSQIDPGIYLLRIYDRNGRSNTQKFVIW